MKFIRFLKNAAIYVLSAIMTVVKLLPKKLIYGFAGLSTFGMLSALVVYVIEYYGIRHNFFIGLCICFGVSIITLLVKLFVSSQYWTDYEDLVDRVMGPID